MDEINSIKFSTTSGYFTQYLWNLLLKNSCPCFLDEDSSAARILKRVFVWSWLWEWKIMKGPILWRENRMTHNEIDWTKYMDIPFLFIALVAQKDTVIPKFSYWNDGSPQNSFFSFWSPHPLMHIAVFEFILILFHTCLSPIWYILSPWKTAHEQLHLKECLHWYV